MMKAIRKHLTTTSTRRRRQRTRLSTESLESRQLLAANPIVTSSDGSITIGADFSSPEVHSFGWSEQLSEISIETGMPIVNGFARTTVAAAPLSGTANVDAAEIQIGGRVAQWSVAEGTWSIDWELNPGVNRIVVQSFDAAGKELDRNYTDIWFDTSGATTDPVSVPFGSVWSYLDDGSDQGTSWRTDAVPTWNTGAAQLGYGDGDETTVVGEGPAGARFVTTYFRHTFNIPDGKAASLDQISIDLLRDDGAVVYINGVEVVRTTNLPGTLGDGAVQFDTWADIGGTTENLRSTFVVPENLVPGLLRDGDNTIAVEVHQHDAGSSDMSFDLGFLASEKTETGFTNVQGVLPSGDTTWSAADGPFFISSDLTVPVDGTLIIEPGTTVYFGNEQSLNVLGHLVAEGTPADITRFTRVPGTSSISDGIQFTSTMQDNRITYAVLEWGGIATNNGLIGLDESKLTLDHVTLDHAERRRIRSIDSSLVVRNSVFTDIFAPNSPPSTDNLSEHIWGRNVPEGEDFIVENNVFGTTKGHNDVIDFDAGFRPAPIPRILNNTFLGGGDDAMDFEGDVHIEANLVMNIIKDQWNTGDGNANGISAGVAHHYFMSRNIFYNVEQVAQVKQDSFLTFVNNTVVGAHVSATYYQRPTGGEYGRGGYLDGNIFVDTPLVLDEYLPDTDLTLNRSAFRSDETSFGVGNVTSDVMLKDPTNFDFNLLPGSPAIGTGPNGVNMGALVPAGASIAGAPTPSTMDTFATLTVGGPETFAYQYRVDGGDWSEVITATNSGTKEQVIPPIELTDLAAGVHTVDVLKRNSAGVWQSESAPTSVSWTVGGNNTDTIDALCEQTHLDFPDLQYDFDGDGNVTNSDLGFYVKQTLGTAIGDANLDGRVDAADLNQVGIHWQQMETLSWSQGNFNCDAQIDAADLNQLGINWQFGVPAAAARATRVPRAALSLHSAIMNATLMDQAVTQITESDWAGKSNVTGNPTARIEPNLALVRPRVYRSGTVSRRGSTHSSVEVAKSQTVDALFERFDSI